MIDQNFFEMKNLAGSARISILKSRYMYESEIMTLLFFKNYKGHPSPNSLYTKKGKSQMLLFVNIFLNVVYVHAFCWTFERISKLGDAK